MNRSAIMKNMVHEDDVHVQDEKHIAHSEGADDSDEDYVYCLSSIFPNTDDDPVEYVYTRDATGRVVSMETRLKVPRNEEAVMETSDKSSRVIHVELPFKKDAELSFKKPAEDNSRTVTHSHDIKKL
jgi:hypothetical protein